MKRAMVILSYFSLFIFATTASALNNPFGLVTDSELESSQAAIDELFDSIPLESFVGIDNKKIKYKIFKNPSEIGAIVISSGRTETLLKYKELVVGQTCYKLTTNA